MRNKVLFVSILLLISNNIVNAQHTVNFNKYGLYIVENGMPTEIKTEKESLACFFEDYLILHGVMSIGYCIYNIRTRAITKWVSFGTVIKVEHTNNLIVYFGIERILTPHSYRHVDSNSEYTFWKWELNPDTLKIISEKQLSEEPFPEINDFFYDNREFPYGNDYIHYTITKKLDDRKYRYNGSNFYLDINYGPDVDLTGKYHYEVQGGKKDIFVVGIHKWDGR